MTNKVYKFAFHVAFSALLSWLIFEMWREWPIAVLRFGNNMVEVQLNFTMLLAVYSLFYRPVKLHKFIGACCCYG